MTDLRKDFPKLEELMDDLRHRRHLVFEARFFEVDVRDDGTSPASYLRQFIDFEILTDLTKSIYE